MRLLWILVELEKKELENNCRGALSLSTTTSVEVFRVDVVSEVGALPHAVYSIRVCVGPYEWSIQKRYSEVRAFHQSLRADPSMKNLNFKPMPTKGWALHATDTSTVEKRRQMFQSLFEDLVSDPIKWSRVVTSPIFYSFFGMNKNLQSLSRGRLDAYQQFNEVVVAGTTLFLSKASQINPPSPSSPISSPISSQSMSIPIPSTPTQPTPNITTPTPIITSNPTPSSLLRIPPPTSPPPIPSSYKPRNTTKISSPTSLSSSPASDSPTLSSTTTTASPTLSSSTSSSPLPPIPPLPPPRPTTKKARRLFESGNSVSGGVEESEVAFQGLTRLVVVLFEVLLGQLKHSSKESKLVPAEEKDDGLLGSINFSCLIAQKNIIPLVLQVLALCPDPLRSAGLENLLALVATNRVNYYFFLSIDNWQEWMVPLLSDKAPLLIHSFASQNSVDAVYGESSYISPASPNSLSSSTGILTSTDNTGRRQTYQLFIQCRDLIRMDALSKSDPVIEVFRSVPLVSGKQNFLFVGRTEVVDNTHDYDFLKTFFLTFEPGARPRQQIRLDLFDADYDTLRAADKMGSCVIDLADAICRRKTEHYLINKENPTRDEELQKAGSRLIVRLIPANPLGNEQTYGEVQSEKLYRIPSTLRYGEKLEPILVSLLQTQRIHLLSGEVVMYYCFNRRTPLVSMEVDLTRDCLLLTDRRFIRIENGHAVRVVYRNNISMVRHKPSSPLRWDSIQIVTLDGQPVVFHVHDRVNCELFVRLLSCDVWESIRNINRGSVSGVQRMTIFGEFMRPKSLQVQNDVDPSTTSTTTDKSKSRLPWLDFLDEMDEAHRNAKLMVAKKSRVTTSIAGGSCTLSTLQALLASGPSALGPVPSSLKLPMGIFVMILRHHFTRCVLKKPNPRSLPSEIKRAVEAIGEPLRWDPQDSVPIIRILLLSFLASVQSLVSKFAVKFEDPSWENLFRALALFKDLLRYKPKLRKRKGGALTGFGALKIINKLILSRIIALLQKLKFDEMDERSCPSEEERELVRKLKSRGMKWLKFWQKREASWKEPASLLSIKEKSEDTEKPDLNVTTLSASKSVPRSLPIAINSQSSGSSSGSSSSGSGSYGPSSPLLEKASSLPPWLAPISTNTDPTSSEILDELEEKEKDVDSDEEIVIGGMGYWLGWMHRAARFGGREETEDDEDPDSDDEEEEEEEEDDDDVLPSFPDPSPATTPATVTRSVATPTPQEQSKLKEGILMKQGHKFRTWKKRFFTLFPEQLVYYKHAGDKQAQGQIFLEGSTTVMAVDEAALLDKKDKHRLTITEPPATPTATSSSPSSPTLLRQTSDSGSNFELLSRTPGSATTTPSILTRTLTLSSPRSASPSHPLTQSRSGVTVTPKFYFRITDFGARTFYFEASSENERQSWIAAITHQIETRRQEEESQLGARSFPDSLKEGWLMKIGGQVKSWKRRYVALFSDRLEYFKKKDDKKSVGGFPFDFSGEAFELKSEVDLKEKVKDGSKSGEEGEKETDYRYLFYFTPSQGQRKYVFAAPDAETRRRWLVIFQAQLRKRVPLMEAVLQKQGNSHKGWKKRYFILFYDKLLYFKSKGDKKVTGQILLTKQSVVEEDENKDCEFGLRTHKGSGRIYRIMCPTNEERAVWVAAIHGLIKRRDFVVSQAQPTVT